MGEPSKVSILDVNKMTPDQVFDYAKTMDFCEVMIIGFDSDGDSVEVHSSMCRKDALWLLEREKQRILDAG